MKSRAPSSGRHWPLRDYPSVFWLIAALVVAIIHRRVPSSEWLLIHLVLLGALSHAIMVWSFYFCEALLHVRNEPDSRRDQARRIGLLLVGSTLVLIGVPTGIWVLTITGATLVAVAASWHGIAILRMLRKALPGRFRISVYYYVASAACLVFGAGFGAILAKVPNEPWHGRLLLAHTMSNLLGWVGLTIMGTLITFWPTLLRTPMDPRSDRLARQALPVLIGGIAVLVTGALVGVQPLAFVGLAFFTSGALWWGRALLHPLLTKPPREFCSTSVALSIPWAVAGLIWLGTLVLRSKDWSQIATGFTPVAYIFAFGMAAQILTGALSYLIPTVLGGGPTAVRTSLAVFNRFGSARLILINASLIVFLLPLPSPIHAAVALTGLVGFGGFLPLLFVGINANREVRRSASLKDVAETRTRVDQPGFWSLRQGLLALATVGLAATVGVLINQNSIFQLPLTGQTLRVTVTANNMDFTPNQIQVSPGDHLIITVVNEDPTTTHDLWIAGHATARLAPGESEDLNLGVITESTSGWCTIPGHKQMGMTLDILTNDDEDPSANIGAHPQAEEIRADQSVRLSELINAALAELDEQTVHQMTMTVEETPLEVAPGIWQKRWTYNGASVGPVLHGRVGDTFEIKLVNKGTMGHSIDFHAGELAPNEPMRTIPPGESLVYRFTANRAGIWMYHCSTMPMSSHIAAGMHGAVIIEPTDLEPADRSYVLVQSELYLTSPSVSSETAEEVDAGKIAAKTPDFITFNGIANQYDQFQLDAKPGERVRFWILDAGPNQPSSFHIVGGQFDTVYLEGSYHLKQGVDAFGIEGGGAQALGLQPAQGGFVEITFTEPGDYPFITHSMSDAESGAHGYVHVTDN